MNQGKEKEKFTDDDDYIELDCSPTKFESSGSEDEDGTSKGRHGKHVTNFMQAEGGSSDIMKQNDSLQRSKYLSSGDFSQLTNKPIL